MRSFKKNILRAVAIVVCLASFPMMLFSCKENEPVAEVVDPVIECGDVKIPLCFYEFMLSRVRADLARNKQNVNSASFWKEEFGDTGVSNEEYYNELVLENCKKYLAAAVLFDEEGLTLTDADIAAIDEEIAYYIDLGYIGDGDVEKFNSIIEPFGVDSVSLKECYIIEAKYQKLMDKLYGGGSLIGEAVKEEFYQENYYRFKQVLFPKFYYKYQKDTNGDMIYFDTSKGVPMYDTENGTPRFVDGEYVVDRFGVEMYFDEEGNILYDKVNGLPAVETDGTGQGIKYFYTSAEFSEKRNEANGLVDSIVDGNFAAFDAAVSSNVLIIGSEDPYPDGYYLSDVESSGYIGDSAYLGDILAALKEMKVGEVRMIESDNGCHVIMKYELDAGKCVDGNYDEWFVNLEKTLMNNMFADKIADILPDGKVNVDNLEKARSIALIGTNFDY